MKKILLFLVLSTSLLFSNTFKSAMLLSDTLDSKIDINDEWFSKDKGMHLAGSFISTGFVMMSGNRWLNLNKQKSKIVGISFTFSLALGKEIYDSRQENNHFSYKDLTADMLGIVLAIIIFR